MNPNESYSDRMNRCADALLAITPNTERIIHHLELYAIFDAIDCDPRFIPIFDECIRSDSDIDEMTAILDDDID